MPSPIYQYVINLVVSLPIRGGPSLLMNVSVREHRALKNKIFFMWESLLFSTITITILMKAIIPNCRFEYILSLQF